MLAVGKAAFGRSLPFNELEAITVLVPYIKRSLKLQECFIVSQQEAEATLAKEGDKLGYSKEKAEASEPGAPSVLFWNV